MLQIPVRLLRGSDAIRPDSRLGRSVSRFKAQWTTAAVWSAVFIALRLRSYSNASMMGRRIEHPIDHALRAGAVCLVGAAICLVISAALAGLRARRARAIALAVAVGPAALVSALCYHAAYYLIAPRWGHAGVRGMIDVAPVFAVGYAAWAVAELARSSAAAPTTAPAPERAYWIKSGRSRVRIPVDSIEWIASEREYLRIFTHDGRNYFTRGSLTHLAGDLDPRDFLRVHRSAIVRIGSVRRLLADGGSRLLVMNGGAEVPVGRSYARTVRAAVVRRL